jgi:protein-L-isoaspartate(D-aspartate) O-methyltransferase
VPELASKAAHVLQDLIYTNIHVKSGDGAEGWPEMAPFDRILMTAAARTVPRTLLAQLCDSGMLIGPVVKRDGAQELVRLERSGNEFAIERLCDCSFVPMVRPVAPQVRHGEPHGG